MRRVQTRFVVALCVVCLSGSVAGQAPTPGPATPRRDSAQKATTGTGKIRGRVVAAPANTPLRSIWFAESVTGIAPNTHIDEAEVQAGGGRNDGTFNLSRPSAGWPPGRYRVELYLAGLLAETLRFEIIGPSSPVPVESPRPAVSPVASPQPTR